MLGGSSLIHVAERGDVQLTFDPAVEAFRAEFVTFLEEYLPTEAATTERSRSTSHIPQWARRWQRLQFDHGWLLPGNPAEFGGRNATLLQQFVHREELSRRRITASFNPQGVGIIAASLLTFGTPEQKQRWAVPILRGEMTASLGMSEPGAGSDLAGLRTTAVRDGDEFVVNGQKVWTSGAQDADVVLTFVRTNPDAKKHQGISVLLIPTATRGVECRPFAYLHDRDHLDFNEVFFTDVRVPAENLVGALDGGWRVANGSLGHERTLLWMSFADRLGYLIQDFRPVTALDRDHYATLTMDAQALRLLGSAALAAASRGVDDVAALSVLKVLGSEAAQTAAEHALAAVDGDGIIDRAATSSYNPHGLDQAGGSWFARYAASFAGTISGGTSEIQRNIIAQRILGLPRG
jgi:alkylation response protein AidB-like acyl-CoA dehydrogenase